MMNYNHAATGSGLTLGTDVSNNNLSLYGTGRLNLNNRHTLTSSLKIDKDRSSNQGELKYIHKPSSSELTFGFKNEPTKTDLSLKGQTQLSNHRLSGSTLFSNNNNRDATSINTSLEYNHKPSNSDLTFGFENKKTGTDLTLKGKTQFSNDHHLGGSAFLNQKFGQLSSMGASLDYNHKPSNSSLNFGYQTRKSGTDLFLTGQTQNDKHSLSSGFFKNTAGGLSTSLDYMHKPSNSKIGLVFENNMHGQQVNLNGDFNLNNKARLGLGGHFANGPNSSSAGFQIAGAF